DYSNLTEWTFPAGATIPPGSFKVVFCDGQTNLSSSAELHANFNLTSGSGELALSLLDTNGVPRILDYLNYRNLGPDHSYGSMPNGQGIDRAELLNATPGVSNVNSSTGLTVAINEWMAGNTHTLKDPVTGKYEDWFELYNYGDKAVSLAGCYLSHALTNKFEFQIPAGYSISPHGFLLVWADKQATIATPELHASFKLSKSGTSICLRAPDGTLLDFVSFGPQTSDIGMGRYPDGSANISILPLATPGNVNAAPNTPPEFRVSGSQYGYLGETIQFLAQAQDEDVPHQSLSYSLDPGSPTNAVIDPLTGAVSWTPLPRQAPSTNFFLLRVTDNGIPPLSATEPVAVIVDLPPALATFASAGNQVTMAWTAFPGRTYQLQYKEDLASPNWTDLGPAFIGNGDVVSLSPTNDVGASRQGFFRLKVDR
ncbi:MAG TPA: lamin tail domain-containing protein, partial [Verrucomicrobiae bacterium]|nr:lamin tail domain-containing protein [Verrucomicrobiae bacterium]